VNKKIKDPDMIERVSQNGSRRDFMKKATVAGAGITAAAVLPGAVHAAVSEDQSLDKKQQGYQLTQHVIDYYKSAAS
jgi:hypothetical protein